MALSEMSPVFRPLVRFLVFWHLVKFQQQHIRCHRRPRFVLCHLIRNSLSLRFDISGLTFRSSSTFCRCDFLRLAHRTHFSCNPPRPWANGGRFLISVVCCHEYIPILTILVIVAHIEGLRARPGEADLRSRCVEDFSGAKLAGSVCLCHPFQGRHPAG